MVHKSTRTINFRGFTLIEILVVIFIIALTTGIILLRGIDTLQLSPQATATRLFNIFKFAELESILEGQTLTFRYQPTGYAFYYWNDTAKTAEESWLPITENRFLKFQPISSRTTLISNQDIIFFSTGECTPFTLKILYNNMPSYEIIGAANGQFELVKLT